MEILMANRDSEKIIETVANGLVKAGSIFLPDKIAAYKRAIEQETNSQAKWTLKTILENAQVAEKNSSPVMWKRYWHPASCSGYRDSKCRHRAAAGRY